MIKRTVWIIAFLILFQGFAYIAESADEDRDAVDQYYAANALYNKKLFKLASEEYKTFIAKYPDHKKDTRCGARACSLLL